MSMDYIRQHYKVPAKRGGRVRYTGGPTPKEGVITSAKGAHLIIRMDGEASVGKYHPTWEIEYL